MRIYTFAGISTKRIWPLVVAAVTFFFLPLPLGIMFSTVLVFYFFSSAQRNIEEITEVTSTVERLCTPKQYKAITAAAARRKGENIEVSITEELINVLRKTSGTKNCGEEHALDCAHRPINIQPQWPKLVQDAITLGRTKFEYLRAEDIGA